MFHSLPGGGARRLPGGAAGRSGGGLGRARRAGGRAAVLACGRRGPFAILIPTLRW